jgi:hypothetical protein
LPHHEVISGPDRRYARLQQTRSKGLFQYRTIGRFGFALKVALRRGRVVIGIGGWKTCLRRTLTHRVMIGLT